jgi:hypothetical protein
LFITMIITSYSIFLQSWYTEHMPTLRLMQIQGKPPGNSCIQFHYLISLSDAIKKGFY